MICGLGFFLKDYRILHFREKSPLDINRTNLSRLSVVQKANRKKFVQVKGFFQKKKKKKDQNPNQNTYKQWVLD